MSEQGVTAREDVECHCGRPVVYGFDGDPTHHRGMCEACDATRCDAYPMGCPFPRMPWPLANIMHRADVAAWLAAHDEGVRAAERERLAAEEERA